MMPPRAWTSCALLSLVITAAGVPAPVLLSAGDGGSGAGGNDAIPCTSEKEMYMNGIAFIAGVCCEQGQELCADGDHMIPSTCTRYPCARTVTRVAEACTSLFQSSAFFDGASSLIHNLLRKCPRLDEAAHLEQNVDVASHAWVHHVDPHGMQHVEPMVVRQACGKTFNGGQSPASGQGDWTVVLSSSTGRKMQLDFGTLWLTPHSVIKVYDGPDRSSPELATITGMRLPPPVRSTGSVVTVAIAHVNAGYPGPSVGTAEGWSFNVTCTCEIVGAAASTVEDITDGSCGAHGTCTSLVSQSPLAQGSSWDTCVCDDGYRGEACDIAKPAPPPPPVVVLECQACKMGYSCRGGEPPCWPIHVFFGPSAAALSSSANSGYIAIYRRLDSTTCADAPVFQSTNNAYADANGVMRPGFLYQRPGLWEGYWAVGPGKVAPDGTDVVNCAHATVIFESSTCPMDSTPGHPFADVPSRALENTPCFDHWRECTSGLPGCAPPPAQDAAGWQANSLLAMQVPTTTGSNSGSGTAGGSGSTPIVPANCGGAACGKDQACVRIAPPITDLLAGNAQPRDVCWSNSYVLGGEMTQPDLNAGLCGEYTRTSTICNGAPVYVRPDAWHQADSDAGGELGTAYLYRRALGCEIFPALLQELTHCDDGNPGQTGQGTAWVIVHEGPTQPIDLSSFTCEGYGRGAIMSTLHTLDCGEDPTALGCDGQWRECQDDAGCPLPSIPATDTATTLDALDDESIWRSNPGLLLASGREQDMAKSVAQDLQRWHWLALAGWDTHNTSTH
jgi:hypothetical protein